MRRSTRGEARGQAIVEYALGIVLVAFLAIGGMVTLGPSISAHILEFNASVPEVRWGGVVLVINPTDRATLTPSSTSSLPATETSEATLTSEPSQTPEASMTSVPTIEPTATTVMTETPTSAPTMTYEEWCLSMGYTWRPYLEVCTFLWTVVTPEP